MVIKVIKSALELAGFEIQGQSKREMQYWQRCCNCGNITSGKGDVITKPCIKCQGTVYDMYMGSGKPDWAK